ncbi:MAG: gliding motility lipoprotein GldD [Flavobacteriales bacterium]|jgi:gliding motility-associated lipoprotein GldD
MMNFGLRIASPACLLALFMISACRPEPMPRPKGYFRIELPQKNYLPMSSECPFTMEVPTYSRIELDKSRSGSDTCRFNIFFPAFRARIHCTYLPIRGNDDDLVRDAYTFAAKHEMKASAIRRTLVEDSGRDVFGVIYDIEGDAASQVQFFVMDSTRHFLRGALYFNNRPNPDSIAPVLAFIREDIAHMTRTVRWGD